MISSKKELQFYILADTMINRGYFKPSLLKRVVQLFNPDIVIDFLCSMRNYSYCSHQKGILNRLKAGYYKSKFLRLSKKCGFSMGADCFGYALLIHHYGTVVCGGNNRIGNFAVLNTSVCITQNASRIGDFFFIGTGAVVSKGVQLGNNVKVAANSVVTKSFTENDIVLAGQPSIVKKTSSNTWVDEYDNVSGTTWSDRYKKIMELKQKMKI